MSYCNTNSLKILVVIILLAVLFQPGIADAATEINSCTLISSPGEYVLTRDILDYPKHTCIYISSDNVVLDGAGHAIDGVYGLTFHGIAVNVNASYAGTTNVTIKNFVVTDWVRGIVVHNVQKGNVTDNTLLRNNDGITLVGSDNIVIANNSLSMNYNNGIYLINSVDSTLIGNNISYGSYGIQSYISDSNKFYDNIIQSNTRGIKLDSSNLNEFTGNNVFFNSYGIDVGSSTSNTIYNNYFNNSFNALGSGVNYWNITKRAGTNVIGGPNLGGNFWSDYEGNDTNGDGLGDNLIPYNNLGMINGDYLPLTPERVAVNFGTGGGTATTDPAGTGTTISDPIETSVTTGTEGTVTIEEAPASDLTGYHLIGQEVTITAPSSSNPDEPLVINFTINSTQIPDIDLNGIKNLIDLEAITIFRNNVEVPPQNTGAPSGRADPDPCISERIILPNGDGSITVLTTSASTWKAAFKVISIQDEIIALIDQVESLNLQRGIENSLDAKLLAANKALSDVNSNNDAAAVNAIGAFINEVEAQRGKQISSENADSLIAASNKIIVLLNA